jgi:hypothetical protein
VEHWFNNCVGDPAVSRDHRILKSYFISPLIGGVFSNPATRWPNTLGRLQFLRVHPYFLPCAISGSIAFATFIIAVLALKEVCSLLMTVYHRIRIVRSDSPLARRKKEHIDPR